MRRQGTNFAQYATAALPPRTRVLGRVLRPFCLAHALLLERSANALWCGGTVTTAELISAVWICSHSHDPATAGGDMPRMRPGSILWLLRAWLACWVDPLVRISRTAMLRDYIEKAVNAYPECAVVDGDAPPQPESVPWPILMHMRLIAIGFSHLDAINLPISQANWILTANAADQGKVKWVSDHEREIFAANESPEHPSDHSLSG